MRLGKPGPPLHSAAIPVGLPGVGIVIPVASLARAKSRLGHVLGPAERRELVLELLDRTVCAARQAAETHEVVVVSRDPEVLVHAEARGVTAIRQRSRGLNPAIREAQDYLAAHSLAVLVVVPIDLPLIDREELVRLIAAFTANLAEGSGGVALVTDRAGSGTNMLMVAPLGLIPFRFGRESRARHRSAAKRTGAAYFELESSLRFDLDEPADLATIEYWSDRAREG